MVTQRKIIVRNPDGTTKVIVQNIVASSSQANKPPVEQPSAQQPTRQKLGIVRGSDGKITSVTGLKPGQQLIDSPQGLRIVTATPNRGNDQKMVVKQEAPKSVAKVTSSTDVDGQTKAPMVVRQQIRGSPANVIVKTVQTNKPPTSTPQRVILNSGQLLSTPSQPVQVANTSPQIQKIITSKRQLLANNTPKVVRASNLQQLLNQGGQKILINQTNTPSKIVIASSAANQNSTTTAAQHTIASNQPQTITLNSVSNQP